ncbi:MAG: ABC transporter ATP-binding protein [Gemmataceae bacterium]
MDEVIQTHGLTRSFGGRRVVDGLKLAVPRGAIYALLGDNGAGKSTTIRMLTGLLPADSGSASILGQDCWSAAVPLRHRVGYVPERPKYYDWMTVDEIGQFAAAFHQPGYAARYRTLVERFRLDAKSKLKTLSKGSYAKVGLALALAVDPEVLILDEPTSGLDLFTRREFLGSMVDLAAEGRTILIASHAVAEVERVASHAAFISAGRLLLAGPLDELRQRLIGVRVRHSDTPVEPAGLGVMLACQRSGREWRAFVLDPDRPAVAALRHRPGVVEVDEEPLTLEEMYTALLAGTDGDGRSSTVNGRPAVIEENGGRR